MGAFSSSQEDSSNSFKFPKIFGIILRFLWDYLEIFFFCFLFWLNKILPRLFFLGFFKADTSGYSPQTKIIGNDGHIIDEYGTALKPHVWNVYSSHSYVSSSAESR